MFLISSNHTIAKAYVYMLINIMTGEFYYGYREANSVADVIANQICG